MNQGPAKRNIITFELRPKKDDDIADALRMFLDRKDRSDVIREALRQYLKLGGRKKPSRGK